ncbi:MAG: late competence development ComFB family protein [Desulfohalobiaceae bacterium]|nr:late competence development ComFB family protein [Desulfohalobiaceae bacterium]
MPSKDTLKTRGLVESLDLGKIRNRNERRVLEHFTLILDEYPDFEPDIIDIQDIYALALNALPPRYTQETAIVLKEPVTEKQIQAALRDAIEKVRGRPTGQNQNREQA